MPDDVFAWNEDDPLARAPGETRKANDALNDYYALGMGRSHTKLESKYRESGVRTRYTTIKNWSWKYDWLKRVDAQVEIDNVAARAFWAEERREIRMEDLKASKALRARAARMRAFPVAEQVLIEKYPDGREKTVIIKPGKWRESDIARMETIASDLARRAAEMTKDRTAIVVEEIDYSSLTDEQLDRIIAGEPIAQVIAGTTRQSREREEAAD